MFANKKADGSDVLGQAPSLLSAPTLAEWQALLDNGNVASPRNKTSTPRSTQATSQYYFLGE